MKTLILKRKMPQWRYRFLTGCCSVLLLLLLVQWAKSYPLPMAWIDPSIWQLFILAVLAYFGGLSLSCCLLAYGLRLIHLPKLTILVSDFKQLSLVQQLLFYWLSFALLFFGFLLSLAAIF